MHGDEYQKDKICTSHVERMNGSFRTFCKRMARLTYCFSKKWDSHRAALALLFAQNQIVLSGLEAVLLPGDYNDNNVVDAADYVIWRKTLGQMGSGLAADGNGNGEIDTGDDNIWRAHFGQTAGSGAALPSADPLSAAIPEP